MNEMQAHGLLIPDGSMPIEVWIDKKNSQDELQNFVSVMELTCGSMMKAYSTAANPIAPSMRRNIWRKSDISTS